MHYSQIFSRDIKSVVGFFHNLIENVISMPYRRVKTSFFEEVQYWNESVYQHTSHTRLHSYLCSNNRKGCRTHCRDKIYLRLVVVLVYPNRTVEFHNKVQQFKLKKVDPRKKMESSFATEQQNSFFFQIISSIKNKFWSMFICLIYRKLLRHIYISYHKTSIVLLLQYFIF